MQNLILWISLASVCVGAFLASVVMYFIWASSVASAEEDAQNHRGAACILAAKLQIERDRVGLLREQIDLLREDTDLLDEGDSDDEGEEWKDHDAFRRAGDYLNSPHYCPSDIQFPQE